jgi:hypothetical protein
MNKNVIIGILIAAVVLIGGYFLLTGNNTTSVDQSGSNTQTPVATSPAAVNPAPNPTLTLGKPIVETSATVSTSISTALVNGQVVPNGAPTTYWFDYGTTTALGSKSGSGQIGSGFNSVSAPAYIVGLRENTVYYFRLSASNNFGAVNGSIQNFKTNSTPAPKPAVPTVHSSAASNISRTTATLNGQVTPNGFLTNYWFEYGKDSNLGNTNSVKSVNASASLSSVSETLSGLEPLTKYYFRLNAQNQFGTVNGSILSFTTQGPLNPGSPTVTTSQASNIGSTSAKLNGQINPNGADTTYWFEYSEDSLLGNIIGSGTSTQTLNAGTSTVSVQANVDSLSKNTKYYYHLVGRNQYGTIYGSIDSFTTKNQ